MPKREERINLVCKEAQASSTNKAPWLASAGVWYVFEEFGITWCPVHKAASSTVKQVICNKLGLSCSEMKEEHSTKKSEQLPILAHFQLKPDKFKHSFMITRHPLSRIASFYANKFVKKNRSVMQSIGAKAIMNYRIIKPVDSLQMKQWESQADQYWEYFKSYPQQSFYEVDKTNPYLNPVIPTFEEFVMFVLSDLSKGPEARISVNRHWKPMSETCSVCFTGMKVREFLKFENWEEEVVPFFKQTGLITQNSSELDEVHNASVLSQSKGRIDYYAQLNPSLISQLERHYALDYELFRYNKYPDLESV